MSLHFVEGYRRRVVAWTIESYGNRVLLACGHIGPGVRSLIDPVDPFIYKRQARQQKMVCIDCMREAVNEAIDDNPGYGGGT